MKSAVITVDVENLYQDENVTADTVDFLQSLGVKATLFVTKDIIDSQQEQVLQAQDLGFEIGSHGIWHPYIYEKDWKEKADRLTKKPSEYLRLSYEYFTSKGLKIEGLRTVGFVSNEIIIDEVGKYFKYFAGKKITEKPSIDVKNIPISNIIPGIYFHPIFLIYFPLNSLVNLLVAHNSNIVLYFHSFDIRVANTNLELYCSKWKQILYYSKTGERFKSKFRILIEKLKEKGFIFTTCSDLIGSKN